MTPSEMSTGLPDSSGRQGLACNAEMAGLLPGDIILRPADYLEATPDGKAFRRLEPWIVNAAGELVPCTYEGIEAAVLSRLDRRGRA